MHRLDLAAGYGPADWPEPFAARLLRSLLDRHDLPVMAVSTGSSTIRVRGGGMHVAGTPGALAAWLSGRSDGADLEADGPLPAVPSWA